MFFRLSKFSITTSPKVTLILFATTLYFLRVASGTTFDGSYVGNSQHLNFLDESVLRTNPIEAIWGMHSQPPLLNALHAFGYLFYPREAFVIQTVWFLMSIAVPLLIFQTLVTLDLRIEVAFLISVVYALYPNTGAYAFWAYSTILIQFVFALFLYSLSLVLRNRTFSLIWLSVSLLLLVLARAPFVGFAAALILGSLLLVKTLNSRKTLHPLESSSTVFAILLIISFQAHLLIDFKQVTSGSLGGFSTLRIIRMASTEGDIEQLNLSACQREILIGADNGSTIDEFPSCKSYSKIPVKENHYSVLGNKINSKSSLQAGIAARDTAVNIIRQNPAILFKGLVGREEQLGSLDYFLSDTSLENRQFRRLVDNLPFYISLLCIAIFFLNRARVLVRKFERYRGKSHLTMFSTVAILLFVYVTSYSLFAEILENDRYKHEAYPIYFVLIPVIIRELIEKKEATTS